jgi:hypothetical protein
MTRNGDYFSSVAVKGREAGGYNAQKPQAQFIVFVTLHLADTNGWSGLGRDHCMDGRNWLVSIQVFRVDRLNMSVLTIFV